jgi:hypothetical protein
MIAPMNVLGLPVHRASFWAIFCGFHGRVPYLRAREFQAVGAGRKFGGSDGAAQKSVF